jgi:hypothetical protein
MRKVSGDRDGPTRASIERNHDEGRGGEEGRGRSGLLAGRDDFRHQGVPVPRPIGVQLVSRAAGALDHAGSIGLHRVEVPIARTHGMESDLAPVW